MSKTTGEHAIFRVSAEDRGYEASLCDQFGTPVPATSKAWPRGVLLFNPQSNGLWIPEEDLNAVADLLIRAYLEIGRRRAT